MNIHQRSAIHFLVFVVAAVSLTLFVLRRAEEAVEEIQRLSAPVWISPRAVVE